MTRSGLVELDALHGRVRENAPFLMADYGLRPNPPYEIRIEWNDRMVRAQGATKIS